MRFFSNAENGSDTARCGVVTTGGETPAVLSAREHRAPTVAVPFGMAVCMAQGARAVLLPESDVCLGTVNEAAGLLPGEVKLFSGGGAEILLRADGAVVINGQVFKKEGT